MNEASVQVRWCSRCKASVPTLEFRLRVAPNGDWTLRHEGNMRGLATFEQPTRCGHVERIPTQRLQGGAP